MADRWRRLTAAADDWLARWRPTRIVARAVAGFAEHQGGQMSAAMAYYAILSLFQVVVLGVVIFSLALGEGAARDLFVDRMAAVAPLDRETIDQVVHGVIEGRGGISLVSVALLAWGAKGFLGALGVGIRRAIPGASRSFWWDRLVDLVVMAGVIGLAFAALVIGLVSRFVGGDSLLTGIIGSLASVGFVFVAVVLLYRVVPRRPISLRHAWPGALAATALWTALRLGFSWYATDVARYETLFGPISTAIGLLVFLYLGSMTLLLGAEITRAVVDDDG